MINGTLIVDHAGPLCHWPNDIGSWPGPTPLSAMPATACSCGSQPGELRGQRRGGRGALRCGPAATEVCPDDHPRGERDRREDRDEGP